MKPNILLIWIQWSGKWTQARKIVESHGYALFEAGTELRNIAKTDTPLGQEVKWILDAFLYVPARCLRDVVTEFIKNHTDTPILFDSGIRSHEQNDVIEPILGEFIVIHLHLDESIAINRLMHRRVDPITNEAFSPDFKWDINPKTGNTLIVRADDTLEWIKKRIQWSIDETLPLIEVWEEHGHTIHHIDANKSVDAVFADISNILSPYSH